MDTQQSQPPELDWISLQKEFEPTGLETSKERLLRKIKENPLVPIGDKAKI